MKNRLRVLRAERDWTQTINAKETGKFDPSMPLAFRAPRLFARLETL